MCDLLRHFGGDAVRLIANHDNVISLKLKFVDILSVKERSEDAAIARFPEKRHKFALVYGYVGE